MDRNKHAYQVRVYLEDTDAFGVLYHAAYVRWFERGRTEWLREMGLSIPELLNKGYKFVVGHLELSFLKPAFLDDHLLVSTECIKRRRSLSVFSQTISNGDGEINCKGTIKVVSIDNLLKPCSIDHLLPDILEEG